MYLLTAKLYGLVVCLTMYNYTNFAGVLVVLFVVGGSLLRHISEYAIQRKDIGDLIEYQIDLSRIRDKLVIQIPVSNSGIACSAWVYKAEELSVEFSKRKQSMEPLSYLNTLNFSYLDPREIIKWFYIEILTLIIFTT